MTERNYANGKTRTRYLNFIEISLFDIPFIARDFK